MKIVINMYSRIIKKHCMLNGGLHLMGGRHSFKKKKNWNKRG